MSGKACTVKLARLLADLDRGDVGLGDIGIDLHLRGPLAMTNKVELCRLETTVWPISTLRVITVPATGRDDVGIVEIDLGHPAARRASRSARVLVERDLRLGLSQRVLAVAIDLIGPRPLRPPAAWHRAVQALLGVGQSGAERSLFICASVAAMIGFVLLDHQREKAPDRWWAQTCPILTSVLKSQPTDLTMPETCRSRSARW